MPGPPGSRLMRPARGHRTRPQPFGITRRVSSWDEICVGCYVREAGTKVNTTETYVTSRLCDRDDNGASQASNEREMTGGH